VGNVQPCLTWLAARSTVQKDDRGKLIKVVDWFDFKFRLLMDVKHDVILERFTQ
jgi:hypothetical protein